MSRIKRSSGLVFGFLLLTTIGAGCTTEVITGGPEPYVYVADLEVAWGIEGSSDPFQCDFYGVDQWIVTANGPEFRESVVDCRVHNWSTESDFFTMSEGNYQIVVEAIGLGGFTLASQVLDYSLIDSGNIQQVFFEFLPEDFGAVLPPF